MAETKKKAMTEGDAGWEQVNAQDGAAWAKAEEGAVFRGELLGRFKRKQQEEGEREQWYYQLRVTAHDENGQPCQQFGMLEGEKVPLAVGDLVNLDERSCLEALVEKLAAADGKKLEVLVRFKEKVQLGKKSFWRADVKCRPLPAPPT